MTPRSLLLFALLLAACTRDAAPPALDAAPPPPATPAPATPSAWPEGIAAYPAATALCNEHVTARSTAAGDQAKAWREIDWSSYAVADDAAKVVAFYKQRHAEATVSVDGAETRLELPSGARLSIFALPTTQTFPSCRSATPAPADRALIVIHRQTVR